MAGLPLSAVFGGGSRRLLMELLAVGTPLGDVVRPVGVGSRPPGALSASSPPKWRGRVTPSSFVAATYPSCGGRGHGPIGPKRPSADIGFPSIGEGRVRLVRAHLCVRVFLRTHTHRGGKKVLSRRKSRVFGVDLTAPEVRDD